MSANGTYYEHMDMLLPGVIITIITSILSIFGAIGILVSYVKCPNERSTLRQLLLALTIADCLLAFNSIGSSVKSYQDVTSGKYTQDVHHNNISRSSGLFVAETMQYLHGDLPVNVNHSDVIAIHTTQSLKSVEVPLTNQSSGLCVTQSFIGTTTSLVSFFYIMFIAGYFVVVVIVANDRQRWGNVLWVHGICWLGPFAILMAALTSNALGRNASTSGPWCWISGDLSWQNQVTWMMVTAQGWEMIGYILGPLFWFVMIYERRKNIRCSEGRYNWMSVRRDDRTFWIREDDWNFRYVPLVFYLFRMWGTIRIIIAMVQLQRGYPLNIPNGVCSFLYIMQCIGDNSQGYVNFILFCLVDSTIRNRMWEIYCKKSHTVLGDSENASILSPHKNDNRDKVFPDLKPVRRRLSDISTYLANEDDQGYRDEGSRNKDQGYRDEGSRNKNQGYKDQGYGSNKTSDSINSGYYYGDLEDSLPPYEW